MKLGALAPLLSTPQRRAVLIALSSAYMLVQLSSLPVALSLPTPLNATPPVKRLTDATA